MKTVIEMAREAGFEELGSRADDWVCFGDEIERFAALVRAAEREACARIAERSESKLHCAAAIRARGQA